jgi:hypothetical protein
VKEKTTIRYIGFRSANDRGRIFDFSVSATGEANLVVSVEIPTEFFAGAGSIRLQEGVGIAYAKLKHLFEINPPTEVPPHLSLTASDLARHRQVSPAENKRRSSYQPAGPSGGEGD